MFLRNYSVVLPNGTIIKKGSTTQTLRERVRKHPYNTEKYKGCRLQIDREQEWLDEDDREFGVLLLRVREQIDISKNHLWIDENGWNAGSPIKQWLIGTEDFEESRRASTRQVVLKRNHLKYHSGIFETCAICHASPEDKRRRRKCLQKIVDKNRKNHHNYRARWRYANDEEYRKAYKSKKSKNGRDKRAARALSEGRLLKTRRTYKIRCVRDRGHSFYKGRCSRQGCGFIRPIG